MPSQDPTMGCGGRSPPLSTKDAFQSMRGSLEKPTSKPFLSWFVKKMDLIPKVSLPITTSDLKALALHERGLIGQVTKIWPYPKLMDSWMKKNWTTWIKGKLTYYLFGGRFYTFLFELKEDRNKIFIKYPYFMDTRGMYLNKWTLDFDLEVDVPSVIHV